MPKLIQNEESVWLVFAEVAVQGYTGSGYDDREDRRQMTSSKIVTERACEVADVMTKAWKERFRP